jgi:hypothetical protein
MYKVASDKRQAALHRGRLADWIDGEEAQVETRSAHQQWLDLKVAFRSLEARLHALPKNSKERKELGLQKRVMQNEITALAKRAQGERISRRGMNRYFVQIAREHLYPAQFKAMWAAANKLYDQDRAEKLAAETEKVDAEAKVAAEARTAAAVEEEGEYIGRRGINRYVAQIAREQLYPAQFEAMWAAAIRLYDKDHARAETTTAETEKVGAEAKVAAEASIAAEVEKDPSPRRR